MKIKESKKDAERLRKLTILWDGRVKSFYKMTIKIITSRTLTLAEARKLVRLYALFGDKYVYYESRMATNQKKLKMLIKKVYF